MAWVPATLGVGLLIAVVYLGGRIVTAKAHTAPRAPVVAQKVTPATPPAPVVQAQAQIQAKLDPPSPPVIESKPSPLTYPQPVQQHDAKPPVTEPAKAVAEPKPAQSAASEDLADLPTITPQAGERYVQIGALIPKAAHRYLGQLHLAQLKPQIAPGPTPDLVRVVVGPFDDRDVLAAVQAQLDAQGIPNFIRRY
ncbi:MAG TPA: SPOR domain-containing protein [Bryobacteraceae bacterium]|nr:SPOR domain-containing protein [Bryobacteraceae bacterium]